MWVVLIFSRVLVKILLFAQLLGEQHLKEMKGWFYQARTPIQVYSMASEQIFGVNVAGEICRCNESRSEHGLNTSGRVLIEKMPNAIYACPDCNFSIYYEHNCSEMQSTST